MLNFSDSYNKIDEIDELVSAAVIASLLEVSAMKPGNVHPQKNIPNTRYEHFLTANVVVYNSLKQIAMGNPIGKNILEAVKITRKWQKGGNINFGILLLFAPILSAAGKMILEKRDIENLMELRSEIEKTIDKTTSEDAVDVYNAIKIIQPGGLGRVQKLDVNDENSKERIKQEKLNLKDVFHESAARDNVAAEWCNNYEICFILGLPYFISQYEQKKDLFKSITLTFLKILSEVPDTLIIRKTNRSTAEKISQRAREILKIKDELKQIEEIKKFDAHLHGAKGKNNPGTTADLVATVIFLAMLKGLHF